MRVREALADRLRLWAETLDPRRPPDGYVMIVCGGRMATFKLGAQVELHLRMDNAVDVNPTMESFEIRQGPTGLRRA